MSTIGSPIETSLLQAAQAQQTASKARDREKTSSDTKRRYTDQIDLTVANVETAEAIRQLPHTESEQAEEEHRSHDHTGGPGADDQPPHVDVTA